MYLNREPESSKGSVSLSVLLVSLAVTVCGVWLLTLCGVCGWCQRKVGKRNKPGAATANTSDTAPGRGEKKPINGEMSAQRGAPDGDGAGPCRSSSMRSVATGGGRAGKWKTVQSHMQSGGLRPNNFGDAPLSSASTLEHIPSAAAPRPRTLVRQQSLQQPLSFGPSLAPDVLPTTSQSLGQLHPGPGQRGGPRGARGGPAGGAFQSRGAGGERAPYNPGSWDHMMGQIRNRGLDVKSFLEGKMVVLSLAIGLAEQDDFADIPDLQEAPLSHVTPPDKRAGGNKLGNNPKGHPPDADGHSSVSDLANSLTSEMVMLSPGSEEDDGPISEKLGRIQFSVGYNFQESTLTVKIMKGQDLPAKDFSGTSDPFVKIYLLPDKKHKLETKVKRKNLNPHWNETFLFEGFPYEKVVQRTLYLQVLDYDRFSRNDPIGEVSIPLNKVDLAHMQTFWKELKPCSDGSGRRGDLLVSLCYNPSANTITVNIIKARNLKAMDIGGTSDPYVKVWLMHKDKRIEKKKTVVMKRCLNPVFNESFPFDVPAHVLRETTIIITVMDKDRLSRNDVIGKIYLSWKSGPAEVKHWKDMMGHPRTAVAQWHALKA
ncbi:hypothetical protein AGOR_G00111360 [Albula goreensis]|uniref:Synaptotagmin-7 n=1 Tax=Albula goreensis TaxID=1534307 RepID=A0A8T3DNS6_9TELE|nr:hypothetical protein AGOR_G00111360 [Albula goreensis]